MYFSKISFATFGSTADNGSSSKKIEHSSAAYSALKF
jgi:hypothetical protein